MNCRFAVLVVAVIHDTTNVPNQAASGAYSIVNDILHIIYQAAWRQHMGGKWRWSDGIEDLMFCYKVIPSLCFEVLHARCHRIHLAQLGSTIKYLKV